MPTFDKFLYGALLVVETLVVADAFLNLVELPILSGIPEMIVFIILIGFVLQAFYLLVPAALVLLFAFRLWEGKVPKSPLMVAAYVFSALQYGAFWITKWIALQLIYVPGPNGAQHAEFYAYIPMLLVVGLGWWTFLYLNSSRKLAPKSTG